MDERETVIRWGADTQTLVCWTSDPAVKRQWERAKWPVNVAGRGKDGKVHSWQAKGIPSNRLMVLSLRKKSTASATHFSKGAGKAAKHEERAGGTQ